jgi:hypothetical protein
VQCVDDRSPPLGPPVAIGIARRDVDRGCGTVDPREKITLPGALVLPWAESPLDRLGLDTEMPQELEILLGDMLRGMLGDSLGGEEPVQVACTAAIEPKAALCTCERRDHTALHRDLQIDHQIVRL